MTKSAYNIESASFQDHSDDLHGENTDDLHGERGDLMEIKEKVQTSMEIREKTSMEPTPFKTIWEVLIFLNNHFLG